MLALIDLLPRNSKYNEAVSLDRDVAESYMQKLKDDPDGRSAQEGGRPMMSDYSLEAELLQDVVNEVRVLNNLQATKAGGHPGKIKPAMGPETVFEKIKAEMREEEHQGLVRKFLPNKAG